MEGRLHDVGGAKVNPMLLRVIEEADQPFPVAGERAAGLGIGLLEAQ